MRKYRLWAAIASLEALFRLALQVITTAILARMLAPEAFGISALVLTLVTIFTVFVGMPFEEALAQRKVLRSAHVDAALAASWLAGLVFLVLSIGLGFGLAIFAHVPEMTILLPVSSLLLFPNVALIIATALARRHRHFNAVALASFWGNFIGCVSAIALAWCGFGVWALLGFRLVTVFAQSGVLVGLIGLKLRPRWSWPHLRSLVRFAWFVLWDRLTENLTYLVFNYLISGIFGLTTLGHFNMAMRVIEPIRGASAAILHNLSFTAFQSAIGQPQELADRISRSCRRAALLIGPVFLGLAAVAPVLIPVLAGPGWEPAIPVTILLGIGSSLAVTTQPLMTALSVKGLPQYLFYRSGLRLIVICLAMGLFLPFGPIAAGLSRISGDLSDTVFGAIQARRRLALPYGRLLAVLARPLGLSLAMALIVETVRRILLVGFGPVITLILDIGCGVFAYLALLALFDRPGLHQLSGEILGRRSP